MEYKGSGDFGHLVRRQDCGCPYERKEKERREQVIMEMAKFYSYFQSFRRNCQETFFTNWKSQSKSRFPWHGYVSLHSDLSWATVLFYLHITPSPSLGGKHEELKFEKFSKTQTKFYSFRRKKTSTMMHHSCPKECIFCDGTFPGCGHYLSLSPEAFNAEKLKHAKFKAEAKAEMAKAKSFHLSVGMKYLIWEARRKGNSI